MHSGQGDPAGPRGGTAVDRARGLPGRRRGRDHGRRDPGLLRRQHRPVRDAGDPRRAHAPQPGRGQGAGGGSSSSPTTTRPRAGRRSPRSFDRRGDNRSRRAAPGCDSRAKRARELDEAIFAAAEGELVGPIETDAGFYVLQVDTINAAATQPLDESHHRRRSARAWSHRSSSRPSPTSRTPSSPSGRPAPSAPRISSTDDEDGRSSLQLAERCSNFSVADDGCIGDDEDDELPPDPVTGEVPDAPGLPRVRPARPADRLRFRCPEEQDPALGAPTGLTPLPQGPQPPPR